jgi:hypothetical protein
MKRSMTALALLIVVGGCSFPDLASESTAPVVTSTPRTSPSDTSTDGPYSFPFPVPSEFVARIDHPLLPFRPGARWVYEEVSSDERNRIVVMVTNRSKIIEGVRAVVVHDRVTTEAGELVEDTYDWYAQDRDGNVWYLGEDTKAYEGKKVSTEGSWQHGVDGAKAGIAMPGEPWVGLSYYQELYRGHAEDAGQVLDLAASATVPLGSFIGLLKTADTTALEPDLIEHKYYAPGIGMVYEQTVRGGDDEVRLLEFTPGR